MPARPALVIAALFVVSPAVAQPTGDWIADQKTGCRVGCLKEGGVEATFMATKAMCGFK